MKRLAIAALAIGLAACNSDSTGPSVSVSGSYTLKTVNGANLPFTFNDGSTMVADNLNLATDGSYSEVEHDLDGRIFNGFGFYTNNNGSIHFVDQTDQITFDGSLSGSVLTVISGSLTEVFQHN
jgi:hypothetical protein